MLSLKRFLPYRLNRSAAAVSAEVSRVYRSRHGLTTPEWRVLVTLGELGAAVASEIGADTAMHKTKVSRAVRGLEARRWLARRRDAEDRRVEHLSLTPLGVEALAQLSPAMLEAERRIVARLTVEERIALDRALAALERAAPRPDPRARPAR